MNQYETGTSGVIAVDADRRALRQPPKLRLMLDMETLGTAPRSVITEIAVVDIDDPQRFFSIIWTLMRSWPWAARSTGYAALVDGAAGRPAGEEGSRGGACELFHRPYFLEEKAGWWR